MATTEAAPFINNPPANFLQETLLAIELLSRGCDELEPEEVFDLFTEAGIDPVSALELLLFLPTAFCRRFIPGLAWSAYYTESFESGEAPLVKYQSNNYYSIIERETDNYFSTVGDQDVIISITSRSAEFGIIQHALNNGIELSSLTISPVCLSR